MNIYTDFVRLLLVGGGGSFTKSLLPNLFFFFLFSLYWILVWESINNSTLVLKINFHVPIVLASDQVQILIWIYSKIVFPFKTQIVYSSNFTIKELNKIIHAIWMTIQWKDNIVLTSFWTLVLGWTRLLGSKTIHFLLNNENYSQRKIHSMQSLRNTLFFFLHSFF